VDELPKGVAYAVVLGSFAALLMLEALRPLRARVEPKLRRVARNLGLAGLAAAILNVLQAPLLVPVAHWAHGRDLGLLNRVELPRGVEIAAAVVLLDYTLWHWHWLTHRVPFLWRFHVVHHVDLDLDASTALRFHFGEMMLSVPYRLLQVVVIGADPAAVALWQVLLLVSILFHHSNLRLPAGLERVLVRVVVTPRMHGIHHSDYENETHSNWSSLLSAWDYLHGTLLLSVPQRAIAIGVPPYRDPRDVTLGKMLALPFRKRRDDWSDEKGRIRRRDHPPPLRRLAE
jgi:sterol desaturase/sphingolipid hydroxylase (fatty acid hydroxylase superfamily)